LAKKSEIGSFRQLFRLYGQGPLLVKASLRQEAPSHKRQASDLKRQSGEKAAVLIDDYDGPVLSRIGDIPLAEENRRELLYLYVSLKALSDSDYIQFLFVAGISNLAKASGFMAFNNLADIALHDLYRGICGFTQKELDSYFAGYLQEALEYGKARRL
jgi:hypothetical protein